MRGEDDCERSRLDEKETFGPSSIVQRYCTLDGGQLQLDIGQIAQETGIEGGRLGIIPMTAKDEQLLWLQHHVAGKPVTKPVESDTAIHCD